VERLGIDVSEFHAEKLSPQELVPAPAQGVLALQTRADDKATQKIVQKINHPEVEEVVSLERKVFNLFRGGCNLPLGIYCEKHSDEEDKPVYKAWAAYSDADNAFPRYFHFETRMPESWPQKVADKIRSHNPASVFITRDVREDDFFSRALKASGYKVSGKAFIEFNPIPFGRPNATDWIFFSSKHAVKFFFEQKPDIGSAKIGVIGKATAEGVRKYGKRADFIGYSTDTRMTGKQFASLVKSGTVLFPQAKDSMRTVQQQFVNKAQVKDLAVYETIQKPVDNVADADIMLF